MHRSSSAPPSRWGYEVRTMYYVHTGIVLRTMYVMYMYDGVILSCRKMHAHARTCVCTYICARTHAHQHTNTRSSYARRGHERITFLLASRCSSIAPPTAAVWRCRLCVRTRTLAPTAASLTSCRAAPEHWPLSRLSPLSPSRVTRSSPPAALLRLMWTDAVEDPSQLTDEQLHLSHGSLTRINSNP